jgi:hypothetical protein
MHRRDGAGQDMNQGERCLLLNAKKILDLVSHEVKDAEAILLTAGLGGGTGSCIGTLAEIISNIEIPLSALITIPSRVEGSIIKVNAIKAFTKLISSPVNSIALIDNQKILDTSSKIALVELYRRVNQSVVETFDNLNRISRNPAYKPLTGFDSEDMRKFFFTKGIMFFGEILLSNSDFQNSETLFNRIKEIWGEGGFLSSDFDYALGTMASVVILAPRSLLKKVSVADFDRFTASIKDFVPSSGIYQGLFQIPEEEMARLYTIVAGLPLPGRIDELIDEARTEGKLLTDKAISNLADIPLDDFAGITLLSRQRSKATPDKTKLIKDGEAEAKIEGLDIKPWHRKNS